MQCVFPGDDRSANIEVYLEKSVSSRLGIAIRVREHGSKSEPFVLGWISQEGIRLAACVPADLGFQLNPTTGRVVVRWE